MGERSSCKSEIEFTKRCISVYRPFGDFLENLFPLLSNTLRQVYHKEIWTRFFKLDPSHSQKNVLLQGKTTDFGYIWLCRFQKYLPLLVSSKTVTVNISNLLIYTDYLFAILALFGILNCLIYFLIISDNDII